MLGFENTSASHVKEGSEATFMQDVVEASKSVPVLAYFTAKWCGPCKTLGPQIEAAVNEASGRIKLVRIDVDANRNIAARLGVQSVPAVFAFADGQPIDGFAGAQQRSAINRFIKKILDAKGGDGAESGLEQAEQLLDQGALVEANHLFSSILAKEPENAAAFAGLIKTHIEFNDHERAESLLKSVPKAIATSQQIESARASLELAKQARAAGPINSLLQRLDVSPDDHQARLELAIAMHASGDVDLAIEQLLELFRRDREWNDGAAKQQLFRIFESLKPNDPLVLRARRRLSSLIFA